MKRWRNTYHRRYMLRKAVVIILLIILCFIGIDMKLRPIIVSVTTNEARIKSIDTINKAIAEELKNNEISYADLITVERSSTGEVLAITTNMIKMNELKSIIIKDVQKELGDTSHQNVGIALGTLIGSDFLHGYGPNIPLRVTLSGNVNADFKSSFESAGINQTKHQIYMNIHTSVYSFLPWFNTTTEVDTNVPVAETIIVGQVPQVVANGTAAFPIISDASGK